MKVVHVVYSFPPDPPAGTELYVKNLAHELRANGVESIIAAPAARDERYELEGLRVRRFALSLPDEVSELYGGFDAHAAASFEHILNEEHPDLLHQHALTHACSTELMRLAKRRGLPVVFTYHTPTVTCQRGTLLEMGQRVCDGRVTVDRCAPCTLHGLGVGAGMSRLVAHTPPGVGEWLGEQGASGGVWTALRMRALTRQRAEGLTRFFQLPDRFVALAPWVGELLRANGVEGERIVTSRHGLRDIGSHRPNSVARFNGALRIAHLGRLDPVKGTELLIRAVRALSAAVELDVFGIVQGPEDVRRHAKLLQIIGGDSRVRLLPSLPPSAVVGELVHYDVVAVPSQWLETGPLVVLEAQAAGVPVVGSALGGIADKVRDGVDGLLVTPYESVETWSGTLARCATDRRLVTSLRAAVRPPRSMADVAREMSGLYLGLHVPRSSGRESVALH